MGIVYAKNAKLVDEIFEAKYIYIYIVSLASSINCPRPVLNFLSWPRENVCNNVIAHIKR